MTTLPASMFWYGGLMLAAAGVLFTLRPVRRLGVPTRRRAVRLAIIGLVATGASLLAGGTVQRATNPSSELDRLVPAFQFSEVHTIEIHAPAERTYRAMLDVTPEEIAFYRALTWACILSTETRVYATDAATRRTFKVYWRTIYPGSALFRVSWLRAIKRRAEGS